MSERLPVHLFITEVFHPEEFLVNDLVFELKKKGYNIEVLTRTPSYPYGKTYPGYKNKLYQKTDQNGIKINRVAIIPGYAHNKLIKVLNYLWFLLATSIFIAFKGKKYKNYFVYQTGPLTVATCAVIGKKLWKKKLIIYTQDVWPDTVFAYGFKKTFFLKKLLEGFVKWIYSNTDEILISCKGFSRSLENFTKNKPITYVPNWSLLNNHTSGLDVSSQNKYFDGINFTFAGNVGMVQNLENVIDGFSLFLSENRGINAFLNIIGDGSNLESLKKIVQIKGIPNVIFWGRKPLNEMPQFFQQSHALIISLINKPIFDLTIPSKFQAYLGAKKPIFCIVGGELKNIISENSLGITAHPSNVAEINEGFKKLVFLGTGFSETCHINAVRLLDGEFNREKNISKITSFLQ
jgi:hypothetical protein